ncbi:helix-turn-helix transcriptional regulator [Kitasatospora kazusensis]|uniref:Helix-turn-helix transcriptional regulator n=1 Tax=Kitasatospora kazusensis TaxID=407974 RepID=A0ABP5LS61_9ACTN
MFAMALRTWEVRTLVVAQERELQPGRSVRDLFGFQLRVHRKRRGKSLAALAVEINRSKTVLSNIETADRSIPPELPAELDEYFESDGIFTALYPLVCLEGFPDWSRRFMELEALASTQRKFANGAFPGLWQTRRYGKRLLELGLPRATPDQIEERWSARESRQALLTRDEPPHIWVVLDEVTMRRAVGSPETMREQISHVLDLTDGPNAVVQVLPFSSGGHGSMAGSITLLDFLDAPRAAYVEGYVVGQLLESPEQVAETSLNYDFIQAAALPPKESRTWLRRVMEEFRV